MTTSPRLLDAIRAAARPLSGHAGDYDDLMELIGDARVVLLGEATHGTHEFYHERARITRRLVEEKGFTVIAVEADWPDAYRVNRYVRGVGGESSASGALAGFRRFPVWMWRNVDVLTLVGWLREHNQTRSGAHPAVGFYGLDLYSLFTSIEAVIGYLDRVDPEAASRARYRYGCFDHFGEDSQAYGYASSFGMTSSCEDAVVQQLRDLQVRAPELAGQEEGGVPEDEFFFAEQNARLVKNAEEYYRSMFRGRVSSWNLRDRHMAETLDALIQHFDAKGQRTRVVVWAHNSHIGDARATEMGEEGEWNLGQLARERYGDDAVLVGFSTYSGTVTAASDWDAPEERKRVRPGLAGSWEELLHEVGLPAFVLPLRGREEMEELAEPRLERAIGVIYRPDTERQSHYFHARLAEQFDAVVHIDQTRALEPLAAVAAPQGDQGAPDTYPSGV